MANIIKIILHPQFKAAIELLKTIDLSKYKTIVDIGCGSGEVTDAITQMAPHARVVGIDASKSMIEKAKETYAKKHSCFIRSSRCPR
jgi:trans-aconitate methyltransferase